SRPLLLGPGPSSQSRPLLLSWPLLQVPAPPPGPNPSSLVQAPPPSYRPSSACKSRSVHTPSSQ
ncbi:B-Cell Cll/Lymphoma 9-Like Protein, partial [Manis pentadactyla]